MNLKNVCEKVLQYFILPITLNSFNLTQALMILTFLITFVSP
jgi:hypothetical protein